MRSKQDSGRIIDWIHSKLKARGRGGLTDAEEELGWKKGQIYNLKSIRDLRVSQLLDLCRPLQTHPATVLSTALGDPRVPCDISPEGQQPEIIERALSARGEGLDEQSLKVMDEAARTAPQATLELLFQSAQLLVDKQKSFFLAICSSCYRKLYFYDEALHCLSAAKNSVCENCEFGDILLRESLVARDLGFIKPAIKKAEQACFYLALSKNLSGLARSITLQASYHLVLKNVPEAKKLYRYAEAYEPEMTDHTRVAFLHGLALCSLDNHRLAASLCRRALTEAKKCSSDDLHGKILWLYAVLQRSPKGLIKAVSILSRSQPIDAALAAADLLELGERRQGEKFVKLLFPIIEKLYFIPEAQQAAERLLTLAVNNNQRSLETEISCIRREINESRARLTHARLKKKQ